MLDRRSVRSTPKQTHEPAHFVWRSPSIAALGWIPFYSAAEHMPDCELRKQWESGDPLLGLLFQSGNPTPPSTYRSVAAFWDQMKLGHFRAAFSADDLVFAFDKAGAPVLAEFQTDFQVGGTPIRAAGTEVRLSGLAKPERRFGGAFAPAFKWTAHSIEVRFQHHFKIGRLCELMSQLMTGSTAPFASFEVGIRVNYLG